MPHKNQTNVEIKKLEKLIDKKEFFYPHIIIKKVFIRKIICTYVWLLTFN